MSKKKNKKQKKNQATGKAKVLPSDAKKSSSKKGSIIFQNLDLKKIFYGLLVLSVIVKGIYFFQFNDSPLSVQDEFLSSDMLFFYEWSDTLHTDLKQDFPLHPYYNWNELLMNEYKQNYPEAAQKSNVDLWNELINGKTYHQEPLYAYTWSFLKKIIGDGIPAWVFIQLLLLFLTELLLYKYIKEIWNEKVALISLGMAIFTGPLLFYAGLALRVTFISFFTILLLERFQNLRTKENYSSAAQFGGAMGLAFLTKSTMLPFSLFLLGFYLFEKRKEGMRWALTAIATCTLVLMPLIIRNSSVGVSPLAVSSVGPFVFANSNNPSFNADYGFALNLQYTTPILHEHKNDVKGALGKSISYFESTGAYMSFMIKKFKVAFTGFEIPNNVNYYFYRDRISILKFTFLNFYILFPLALGGMFLCLMQKQKEAIPLFVLFLISLALLVVFYNLSRLRAPIFWIIIPFAAYAIHACIEFYQKKDWKKIGVAILGVCIGLVAVFTTVDKNRHLYRNADYGFEFTYVSDRVNEYMIAGEKEKAIDLFDEFIFDHLPLFMLEPNKINHKDQKNLAIFLNSNYYEKYLNFCQMIGEQERVDEINAVRQNLLPYLK